MSPGGVGLDAYMGVGNENSYGVFAAPAAFMEFDSESLGLQANYLAPTGLRGGELGKRAARHKETTRRVSGAVSMKVPNKGFGTILDLLHGDTVTPAQQGAGPAFLQTHEIGLSKPHGKSKSLQFYKPAVETDVDPFTYLGCVLSQLALTCEMGGDVSAELTIDGRDEDHTQDLATPSYAANIGSFDFTRAEVLVGGSPVTDLLSQVGVTIPIVRATERWGMGSGPLVREPKVNDHIVPTLSFASEYTTDAVYDLWRADTALPVVIRFTGAQIATTYHEMLELTFPAVKLTGTSPAVGGPGIISREVPAEAYMTGASAITTIKYQSTDSALYPPGDS